MPERDIESLGVMEWGLETARKFFRRRRRRRRRPPYRLVPVGMGWVQGERSEPCYVVVAYLIPTL